MRLQFSANHIYSVPQQHTKTFEKRFLDTALTTNPKNQQQILKEGVQFIDKYPAENGVGDTLFMAYCSPERDSDFQKLGNKPSTDTNGVYVIYDSEDHPILRKGIDLQTRNRVLKRHFSYLIHRKYVSALEDVFKSRQ